MERLLKDEIKSRFATNIVQSRKFSELLVDSLAKYRNRAIETAQVVEEREASVNRILLANSPNKEFMHFAQLNLKSLRS